MYLPLRRVAPESRGLVYVDIRIVPPNPPSGHVASVREQELLEPYVTSRDAVEMSRNGRVDLTGCTFKRVTYRRPDIDLPAWRWVVEYGRDLGSCWDTLLVTVDMVNGDMSTTTRDMMCE